MIEGYEPPMAPVPGLGEHTDIILADFGLRPDEIDLLREQGAIGSVQR